MTSEKAKWITKLLKGLATVEEESRIGLLFVFREGCEICENIFDEMDESIVFYDISKNFVLMKVEESEETEEYQVDGTYTPRILFIGSDGSILDRYCNESLNLSDAKYYYCDEKQITRTMRRVFSEQMDPSRHDCVASNCAEGWKSHLTVKSCGFAILALVPPILLLIFSNKLY